MSDELMAFSASEQESEAASVSLLLVESDAPLRERLAFVLTAGGYDVFCAADGLEALELIQRERFPIALTALDLPHKDGIELARELHELDPYAECILLAESNQLPRVIEAVEAGNVYSHFWKPLEDIGNLAHTIARALERRDLRLTNARLLIAQRDSRNELHALTARLEQLDRVAALGQMTQAIAQNMEPPLKNLLAYAQYLRARLARKEEEPLTAEQISRIQDYLNDMGTSVQMCCETVQGLLAYADPHVEPPGPVELHRAIEEAVNLLRPSLEAQNIRCELRLDPSLGPVRGNPHRLRQVIVNLLLNAQQAMDRQGGVLTLTTERHADEQGQEMGAKLTVTDTGVGIPLAALPHIFNAFFTTRSRSKNLGIGLTIARKMLREWRGAIQVESVLGEGTTVHITLPTCVALDIPQPELELSVEDDQQQAA